MKLRALRSSSWLKLSLFTMLLACNACSNSGSNTSNIGGGNGARTAASTAPARPLNVTATGGHQQISLAWSASTGANSYNLKRAASNGGPYSTVASPAGASYIDTTVTNGTTYYYVVTAVNAT